MNPSFILGLRSGKHPPLVACHLHNDTLNLGSMAQFAITLYNHTIRAFVSNSQICHFLTRRGKMLSISSPYQAAGNCTRQLLRIPTLSWPSGNQWGTAERGQNIMMEHNQYQRKVCMRPFQIGGQCPDVFLIMFT